MRATSVLHVNLRDATTWILRFKKNSGEHTPLPSIAAKL